MTLQRAWADLMELAPHLHRWTQVGESMRPRVPVTASFVVTPPIPHVLTLPAIVLPAPILGPTPCRDCGASLLLRRHWNVAWFDAEGVHRCATAVEVSA